MKNMFGSNRKFISGIIKNGAAAVMLCGAIAVSMTFSAVSVHAVESAENESIGNEPAGNESTENESVSEASGNDEDLRKFKYRTLKALNELRDMGLTPQAVWDEICGLTVEKSGDHRLTEGGGKAADDEDAADCENVTADTEDSGLFVNDQKEDPGTGSSDIISRITEKAGDTANEIGKQASEAAKKAGDEAADRAAEEVKKQAGNAIDSFADKISEAFQNFVDSIFNAGK